MYDLIVIGGGFWGTMAALQAREAGLDTLLLDDLNPQGASRNAAGIVSLGWYALLGRRIDRKDVVANIFGDTFTRSDVLWGVNFLRERGLLKQTGEEVFTLAGNRKFREDLWLLSAPQDLFDLTPRTWAKVDKLVKGRDYWAILTENREHLTRRVILAAGAFTDTLLEASNLPAVGVKGLRGRGLLIDPHKVFDVPHTVQVAPYSHLTLRPWQGGMARVGDTVERTPGGEERLLPLKALAEQLAPNYQSVKVFDGLRPVMDKAFIQVIKPGLVVVTGGHRVGLALAPSAARKALALLGIAL